MKIAFSTLGCPDFSWEEIYSMAKDIGFHGIEMRGLSGNIFSLSAAPFKEENIARTKEKLDSMKLEISCLSSGCALRFPERRDEAIEEIRKYIALASKIGCPYIRVLGDLTAEITSDFDDEYVI